MKGRKVRTRVAVCKDKLEEVKKMKVLVTFGWVVEEKNIDRAVRKAKKNLKPTKERSPVIDFSARKLPE